MPTHPTTTFNGPIDELEQRFLESMPAIERWFRLEWMEHTPLFYSAVNIRNTGSKLAPLHTGLFPNGWNHLAEEMLPLAVQAAMAAIEKICPEARNLLIVLENHWPSPDYLANVVQLQRIFNRAGLHVRLGSISPDFHTTTTFPLDDGASVVLEPVLRSKNRLGLHNFDPCTILLNTDLRAGAPGILEDLHEQYLLPPLHAGWSVRHKNRHLQSYEEVAKRLGKMLGIDPWLISPLFATLPAARFTPKETDKEATGAAPRGVKVLLAAVDAVLTKVRRKYKEYGIHEKPFVVIKAHRSGSGIRTLTVRDTKEWGADLPAWLTTHYRGQHDLIVQEGLPTQERIGTTAAEPVVYMMDRYVVGGFYHLFTQSATHQSTDFAPLTFKYSTQQPQPHAPPGASAPNRFYMYGVIARLAMLAASYELEATDPDAET